MAEAIFAQEAQDEAQREMLVKEGPETPSLLSRARFQASAWEAITLSVEGTGVAALCQALDRLTGVVQDFDALLDDLRAEVGRRGHLINRSQRSFEHKVAY